jgi:uncharacterized membrane protein YvlD (DUF360 family)
LLIKLVLRFVLVTAAFLYVTPYITGVKFHGDIGGALIASLIFNAVFFGFELLMGCLVFGINITTLGLGKFISSSVSFLLAFFAPSLALFGLSKVMPNLVHIGSYYPGAIVYGLMLAGIIWASQPEHTKSKA